MGARRRIAAALAATFLLAAPLASRAAPPDVEASVYAPHVASGEPITLQIRLRGDAASSKPDLWPLERDFEVLDVHQTHRTSIVNGARDESVDYVVALSPKRDGDLVIPALVVGRTTTDPIPVSVGGAPDDGVAERDAEPEPQAPAEPVRIETHLDRADPYEQERVLLRIDLYAAGEVLEGALSPPEVPGAVVQQLGEDRPIQKEFGGRPYTGIERTYTIVPESSGELAIAPIRFEGTVRLPRPQRRLYGRSLFDEFFAGGQSAQQLLENFLGAETRRLEASSAPARLHVQARPAAATGDWWLPARALSLTERWDPAAASVRVGDPITRHVEIRADGVSPAQLPPLEPGDVAGVKQYAEAPKVAENVRGTVRVDETTLIPTQPGAVTLPPVEIAWWDTNADQMRTATLPARSLEVLPAAGGSAPSGAAPAPEPAPAAAAAAQPEAAASPGILAGLDRRTLAALATLAAVALFWLGVLAARLAPRRRERAAPEPSAPSLRPLERALRRACRRNDAAAAENALRALRRLGAETAPRFGDGALGEAIARLHAVRYSTQGEPWSGAALWSAWRRARRPRPAVRAQDGLPPLYPAP